jgi:copper resistance protein B
MRTLALVLTPIALAVAGPVGAQDHSAHQTPPAATSPAPQATTPQAADPHAGHNMQDETRAQSAGAQSGPAHAADIIFDPVLMARTREQLLLETGGMRTSAVYIDELEATWDDEHEGYAWDAQGWYGGDIHRFWWKSEGEGDFDSELEYAELQLLYSRAITPYFDVQAGVRQSYRPEGDRTDLVLGVQGLAPYWFEVGAEAFVSDEGEFTARAQAEYDLRLTQRLILQPSAEINLSADDIPEFHIASGITAIELGARLRYEVRRDFAPYVGVEWESAVGETRDLVESSAEEAEATRLVVGLRAFF